MKRGGQRGTVLLICMTLLMLLGLFGLSAMQVATQQQRMSTNLQASLRAFEAAESLLRQAEGRLPAIGNAPCSFCLPPPEAEWVRPGRPPGGSGLSWQTAESGLYLVQNLGQNKAATQMPEGLAVTLYRVTAVGLEREARVVLESIFAWPELPGDVPARRIAWRQVF